MKSSTTRSMELGPPIVQYWHADDPPDYIQELLGTFDEFNPDMRHLVFSEGAAEQFIAENFSDREVTAFRACAVPAMQADYFRLCGVLAIGGFYADADFRCLGALHTSAPGGGGGRLFRSGHGGGDGIMNGFFAFESPGHPFLELSLEIATMNIDNRLRKGTPFIAGPALFVFLTRLGRYDSLDAMVAGLSPNQKDVANLYCKGIGSHTRGIQALSGIEISTRIGPPACIRLGDSLPYKSTSLHWKNFNGDIFR